MLESENLLSRTLVTIVMSRCQDVWGENQTNDVYYIR